MRRIVDFISHMTFAETFLLGVAAFGPILVVLTQLDRGSTDTDRITCTAFTEGEP